MLAFDLYTHSTELHWKDGSIMTKYHIALKTLIRRHYLKPLNMVE